MPSCVRITIENHFKSNTKNLIRNPTDLPTAETIHNPFSTWAVTNFTALTFWGK